MSLEIVMPKLGLTMREGRIVEWKKREGDQVEKGEILFILETEKVTYEVESPGDGILGKILIQENDTVPVGAVVTYLLKPGEAMPEQEGSDEHKEEVRSSVEDIKDDTDITRDHTPSCPTDDRQIARIKASPLAKKIAKSYDIDLREIMGSGSGGRIIREDIERAYEERQRAIASSSAQTGEASANKVVKLTGMRRAIAKKMLASKVETAQTYMSITVDATTVLEYRNSLLAYIQAKSGIRITITDILMKIAGTAIMEHPVLNTRWTDEGILFLKDVHMGMAMALDDGLIVPVIRNINKKCLADIAKERVELIQKGREESFLPDDIKGSTFTLSTLGMFGVEQFTANINLPESGILAVGAILDKPVAIDGEMAIRPMMNISLSYDHRIIDGAEAGKFMQTLKSFIENPIMAFA